MKKRIISVLLLSTLVISTVTGCGEAKKEEKPVQKTAVQSRKKETKKIKESDLKDVVTGLEDHYVLQNTKNIDYMHGLSYDKSIVKSVDTDSKEVKLDQPGSYNIAYKVTVDVNALQKYQSKKEDNAEAKKDNTDSKKIQDIEVKKKIEVVDEKKAQELADNGTVVWKDNNETVPKSDGTEVEEKTETPASTDSSEKTDKNTASNADSGDKKTETSKNSSSGQTTQATGNTQSGNKAQTTKPNQSNSNTSAQPAKPSQSNNNTTTTQPAQTHNHKWVIKAATGHYVTQTVSAAYDEPIYETLCVFPDGHTCKTADEAGDYSVDTGLGYSVKSVQTGTKHHDAVTKQVWVQDTAAYTYCSECGARQ